METLSQKFAFLEIYVARRGGIHTVEVVHSPISCSPHKAGIPPSVPLHFSIPSVSAKKSNQNLRFRDVRRHFEMFPPHRIRLEPSPRAFTLVGVLLILALVTVLVVGTTMLSQIERRAASNAAKTEAARQNALFALNSALAQMQKAVGPDQRVSARADILDNSTIDVSKSSLANPLWTGVWKTFNANSGANNMLDVGTGPDLRSWSTSQEGPEWLISQPKQSAKLDPTSWTGTLERNAPTSFTAVELAKNIGADQNLSVVAPVVPIIVPKTNGQTTNQTSGGYAYWVSDEGIKANVLPASTKIPESIGSRSDYLTSTAASFAPGSYEVTKIKDSPFTSSILRDENSEKVSNFSSLKQLSGTNKAGFSDKRLLTDLTIYSRGVLSNVRDGGLKFDLTAAFEDDFVNNTNPSGNFKRLQNTSGSGKSAIYVYRPANSRVAYNGSQNPSFSTNQVKIDGLQWFTLYKFYNLFKTTSPMWRAPLGAGTNPGGIPAGITGFYSTQGNLTQALTNYNDQGFTNKHVSSPLLPKVALARMDVTITSEFNTSTNKYDLYIKSMPLFVLWNPYAVPLVTTQNATYNYNANYLNVNNNNLIRITVNNVGLKPFDVPVPIGSSSLDWRVDPADVRRLEPGEFRVFGLASDSTATSWITGNGTSTDEWQKNSAQIFSQIPDLKSSNPNVSTDFGRRIKLPTSVDPGATIAITFSSGRMRANTSYFTIAPGAPNAGLTGWPDGGVRENNRFQTFRPTPVVFQNKNWSGAVNSLEGSGILIIGFSIRSKGMTSSSNSTSYANAQTNMPVFQGNSETMSDVVYGLWREVNGQYLKAFSSTAEVQTATVNSQTVTSGGQYSVGDRPVDVPAQNFRAILYDIPFQPLVSLGQFTHMASFYFSGGSYDYVSYPGLSVGGSYASPDVSLDRSVNLRVNNINTTAQTNFVFDHSFAANQSLFDRYFLSTIPPAGVAANSLDRYPVQPSGIDGFVAGSVKLANSRIKFWKRDGDGSTVETFKANLRNTLKASSNLMVDGAFNVNSTSVEAWVALLSSLRGKEFRLWNVKQNQAFNFRSTDLNNPIPRFWSFTLSGQKNELWEGMRDLSDAEVRDLAEKIVTEVKKRGPFLSMGDFLNRRLGTTKSQLTTMGALQAAIDNSSVNSNTKFRGQAVLSDFVSTQGGQSYAPGDPYGVTDFLQPGSSNYNWLGTGQSVGPQLTSANSFVAPRTSVGVPGYLLQQDVVQAFAPVMSVRSDTFTVRVYGDVRNSNTGKVEGKAWGEAVVQRLPEYVDQSDAALKNRFSPFTDESRALGDATPVYDWWTSSTPNAVVNKTNQTLGRRLKVVAFRWLNETDL